MNRLSPLPARMPRPLRAALVAAIALALCGCRTEVDLHSGLTDADANRVVAALRGDGMQAQKRMAKGGVTVSVAESDLARATAVLNAAGLPHQPAARMGEVFKKEGLISSPLEERARYIYALSQELESTLGQIDGVVVARVHVVLPEKVAPGEAIQPPSAAVFIKHLPSLEPDAISHLIKQLVARSVPGLGAHATDRVSAVFVVADAVPQRKAEPPAAPVPVYVVLASLLGVTGLLGGLALVARRKGWRLPSRPQAATPPAAPAAAARPPYAPSVTT